MHWLEQHLKYASTPDTIVHLGAGFCSELGFWRQTGAKRIVLVEPNPEILPDLRYRTDEQGAIEIIAAAITDRAGRGSLCLFNFSLLNSLREPTGLFKSLPGLEQVGQVMVELLPTDSLLDQLNIDTQGDNWLIVDTPGEEAVILQDLENNGRLHCFTRIFLSAGCESHYRGAETASEIVDRLSTLGYQCAGPPDHADADWPRYHLHLDRLALECNRLELELAEHKKQETEYKAELLRSAEALENVRNLLAESERVHQDQLSEAKMAAEDATQSYRKELETIRKQHEKAESINASRIKTLEAALSEQSDKAHQQEIELESVRRKFAAQAEQTEALQSRLSSAIANVSHYQDQLEKTQADLSLALRLQSLRENDLRELQNRYGEILAIKEEQEDLLTQLHHRLSRAAQYLQLTRSQGEDQRLPDELFEALAGKDERPE
jgi:FkbM family methyltransferase